MNGATTSELFHPLKL